MSCELDVVVQYSRQSSTTCGGPLGEHRSRFVVAMCWKSGVSMSSPILS